jgi:hypothetical protein
MVPRDSHSPPKKVCAMIPLNLVSSFTLNVNPFTLILLTPSTNSSISPLD